MSMLECFFPKSMRVEQKEAFIFEFKVLDSDEETLEDTLIAR